MKSAHMVGWLWKCVVVLVITEADSDDRFRSVYERNLTKLLEDTRSCVADFISLSTIDLTSRFSKELLAIACAKKTKWQNQADRRLLLLADAVSGTADGVVTKSQLEWLNAVRNCTDVANCLCTTGSCPADLAVDNNDSNSTLAQQKRQKRQRTHQANRPLGRVTRKEYRRLTDEERVRFHAAMNKLKADMIDTRSKYDLLTIYHTPEQSPGAHWGPAFLPWHREILRQLEVALRAYDPSVSVPYWDSTLDESLPVPKDSVLWTEDFMGDGNVQKEFRITRDIGGSPFGSLYKSEDLDTIMGLKTFADLTTCVGPFFELVHGAIHMWVGGHMGDLPISPNDPSFFHHHAFVDYIWESWRKSHQAYHQREVEYVPEGKICNGYHSAQATMLPFSSLRNFNGLSNSYTDRFYQYEPRPICDQTNQDCRSPYLWCDVAKNRCNSKIRLGGNCAGLESFSHDVCHNSVCQAGVCQSFSQRRPNSASVAVTIDRSNAKFLPTSTLVPPVTQTSTVGTSPTTTEITTTSSSPETSTSSTTTAGSTSTEATTTSSSSTADSTTSLETTTTTTSLETTTTTTTTITTTTPEIDSPPTRTATPQPNQTSLPSVVPSNASVDQTVKTANLDGCPKCVCTTTTVVGNDSNLLGDFERNLVSTESNSSDFGSQDNSDPNSPSQFVFFPLTILQGSLRGPLKSPPKSVKIITKGLNYQGIRDGQYDVSRTEYPNYPGGAYANVRSPTKLNGHTEAFIEVTDSSTGQHCVSHCFFEGIGYVECPAKLVLDDNPHNSDPVPFTASETQVAFLGWNGRKRKPNYFMFLCPAEPAVARDVEEKLPTVPKGSSKCRFLAMENFMIVGHAEIVKEPTTLAECKYFCARRAKERPHGATCGSAMWWANDRSCVITSRSRATNPELFIYSPNDTVTYLEYSCNSSTNLCEEFTI